MRIPHLKILIITSRANQYRRVIFRTAISRVLTPRHIQKRLLTRLPRRPPRRYKRPLHMGVVIFASSFITFSHTNRRPQSDRRIARTVADSAHHFRAFIIPLHPEHLQKRYLLPVQKSRRYRELPLQRRLPKIAFRVIVQQYIISPHRLNELTLTVKYLRRHKCVPVRPRKLAEPLLQLRRRLLHRLDIPAVDQLFNLRYRRQVLPPPALGHSLPLFAPLKMPRLAPSRRT